VDAVRQALADGTIDCIATDHAPHPYDAKDQEFDNAPFGVVGLETALGVAMVDLVDAGALTLPQLVRCLSSQPAAVAHLPSGTLARGTPADVVVFDPKAEWAVDPARFFSKSRNTPFAGRRLRGLVRWTLVGGRVVHTHGA
jgi:dihydroorotase